MIRNIDLLRFRAEPKLLSMQGVTGVGNLEDRIRLYVEGTPDIYPTHIDGVRLEVVKTGRIKALALMNVPWFTPMNPLQISRLGRFRPAPGGCSIGHPYVTAGTLGCAIRIGGSLYALSNNHVFAAGSTILNPRASIGDPIYQPGVYDGGTESDTIGNLAWYQPFNEAGQNLVDAALMKPATDDLLLEEVLDIGAIVGVKTIKEGDLVQKSGRTTAVTATDVIDVNATTQVDYGVFTLTLTNQIITNYMANGGDSGSALLDMNRNLVGLLFAGSSYVTVHNHIANVLNAIGVPGAPPGVPGAPTSPYSFILPAVVGSFLGGIL